MHVTARFEDSQNVKGSRAASLVDCANVSDWLGESWKDWLGPVLETTETTNSVQRTLGLTMV
jgi:hypothetical protein